MSEINPMNNKKYIEAVSFRDWQTCDLICDEHSVLVGRIKHLQKDLDLALNALQRESEVNEELEQELQKTREQLNKCELALNNYAICDDVGTVARRYFKDKQGDYMK